MGAEADNTSEGTIAEGPARHVQPNLESTGSSKPQSSTTKFATNREYHLEGQIDRINVGLTITFSDGLIFQGRARYVKAEKTYPVAGEFKPDGDCTIKEFTGANGEPSWVLKGKFVSRERIEGTCALPDGSRSRPFFFELKMTAQDDKVSAKGSTISWTESNTRGEMPNSSKQTESQNHSSGSPESSTSVSALAGMYAGKVCSVIQGQWRLVNDQGISGLKAAVEVQIAKTGEVLNIHVVKSSGNPAFDESAVRAIERSSPLPAVPEVFVPPFTNKTKFIFTFSPGRVS